MTDLTVNGDPVRYALDPATPLLWALRDASNLTGTKYGCDSGDCGACTVLVDGQAALSCQLPLSALEGAQVVTIEGLPPGPLQQAWAAAGVSACGMCDPGFIMALTALLRASPKPAAEQLAALPNLCRCGAGPRILKALAALPVAAPPIQPHDSPKGASPR
ncbi:(2Fe-2S)-binding protein [Sphingomonas sp. ASV193]|uniref:(2Fe-2S)-binding protein n=1 Tax=Sphingomonas sp. ASV193 TaxID=3144405 RepID=UPI0032E891E3